jgi:hypothetical protein
MNRRGARALDTQILEAEAAVQHRNRQLLQQTEDLSAILRHRSHDTARKAAAGLLLALCALGVAAALRHRAAAETGVRRADSRRVSHSSPPVARALRTVLNNPNWIVMLFGSLLPALSRGHRQRRLR